jgi:hypothetical protein
MMRHLAAIAFLLVLSAGARADEASNVQERADYFDAVQISNRFLACVDQAANADDDPAAVQAATDCFGGVNAPDFSITIDGAEGSRTFATPAEFNAFATGPANIVRTSVSLLPGTYTALDFRRRTQSTGRSVDLSTVLTIVQNIDLPNPVFGRVLGGQIARGVIRFTVTEVGRNTWRITRSRFTILALESGLDIQFLQPPAAQ